MISVKGLSKYYGAITAIEDVTFEVEQGEIVGFLGPNGAGKTTTMRILSGFSPPSRGTATIAGFDVSEDPVEVKRRIGYLPESVPLYHEMTVFKFLRYVAEIKDVPRRERTKEVERVMERCGLSHMAKRVIRNLSKGYRQRVGLGQALLANPPVLILDEPTVGLDPKQIIDIRHMIKELAHEHTVLLSTHILPEVTMICERVLIINQGRLVAKDVLEDLASEKSLRLELDIAGDVDKALAVLRDVPGVESVAHKDASQYEIQSVVGEDVADRAVAALVQNGLGVRRVHEIRRTLEEVFVEAISAETRGNGLDNEEGVAE